MTGSAGDTTRSQPAKKRRLVASEAQNNRIVPVVGEFAFGLVHGLGFASVLREMGIGTSSTSVAVPLFSSQLRRGSGTAACRGLRATDNMEAKEPGTVFANRRSRSLRHHRLRWQLLVFRTNRRVAVSRSQLKR